MPNLARVQPTGGAPVGGGSRFRSRDGTVGHWSTEAPDDFDWTGDSEGYWPVSRLRQGYVDYLTAKALEYEEQKQARHYYHGAQWTPEEIRLLRTRRQPIITFNDLARKIDSIAGLTQRIRQDPKAYPRNPKNADGAEIATQCVRAVLESGDWEFVDPWCAQQAAIEGIGGVEIKLVDGDHADPDLAFDYIFGDDFFYDPRSYKPDFSDARYMGIAKWLDVEAAIELFPDKEVELRTLMVETGFDLTTHSDREFKWIYVNEKRLRLVEQWYQHDNKWYWAFYCSMILLDQGVSPFLDERNQPMNRFVMWSAAVDHDGDRYGFTRNLRGPQDEENQRRSKALFMSNVSRLYIAKGAVDDVEKTRKENARPDGVVEYNPGFEKPEQAQKTEDLTAQLSLMQDARGWINSFANIMPDSLRADEPTEHSGVAINYLQKAGVAELGAYLRNYKNWKKRVYRTVWNIIQRNWTAERFIRVTDSQGLAQFIQINGQDVNEFGQPVIINAIGNLSVEMTMDEGPDEGSLMLEAWDVLKQQPPGTVPLPILVEFMPISATEKKRIQQLAQAPTDPLLMQAKTLALEKTKAEVHNVYSQAEERRGRAVTDAARAAHLAAQAGLSNVEAFKRATENSETPPTGAPQEQQPSPPQNMGGLMGGPPGGPGGPPGAPPAGPQGPAAPRPVSMAPVRVPHTHPLLRQARPAPDGHHYVPDPRRPGKYLHVGP